jgi:hypothetical protein
VIFLSQSPARGVPQATIAVLVFALLVTQAGSFVCGAQCLQHQHPNGTAAAMTHCHAMHPSTTGITTQTCPPTATSFCVIDLLANTQQKILVQSAIQADARPTLLPVLTEAARTTAFPPQRSTPGDPPLLTPLRV